MCIEFLSCFLSLSFPAAFDYLKNNPLEPVDIAKLNEACGVGVVVTRDQILEEVEAAINNCREELLERRYRFNVGKMMSKTICTENRLLYLCVIASWTWLTMYV